MRVSYSWLKDYIDIKLSPEKLAELLTMSGLAVESVGKSGDDSILELEITSNRPDWLSMIGIAREVAALTGKKLKVPRLVHSPQSTVHGKISIKIEDKKLCPRYTGRIIHGVTVKESPQWLRARLESIGLRSVNNIVDITNFSLFETGEPMHAFDLDKIEGGEVVVRRAKRGDKIVTIDGVERALEDSDLLIADAKRPIAIAGVMGGIDTEVTATTKNILLEAASFDPISVRRTVRRLALPTESSYRFERKVDIENIAAASDRASALVCEIAGGRAGSFIDIGKREEKTKTIELRYARLNKILGINVPPSRAKGILKDLGLRLKSDSKTKASFTVPSFRIDIQNEADLIEEVARIYGYDRIPTTIPDIVEQPMRRSPDMVIAQRVREWVTGLGLNEIISYSLVGRRILSSAGADIDNAPSIKNPLTSEQEIMRPSLMPGMLSVIVWNLNRKEENLKLFELGNVYLKKEANFSERKKLAIGMTGAAFQNWEEGRSECGFFHLKGAFEALFSRLGVKDALFKETSDRRFSKTACAAITIGNEEAGVMGEVSASVLRDFDIKTKAYYGEVDMAIVAASSSLEKAFSELPKYPSVLRDISIVTGKDARNGDMVRVMKDAAGPLLKSALLIDRYTGKQIPDDKASLTYRLEYQDPGKTLEEKEISETHARILRALEEKFSARLR